MPLFIIGKGNSIEQAEYQCGELMGENKLTYSSSSYITYNCFIEYLNFWRGQFTSNVKIHLLIDSYSTHTSQMCKGKAAELNIEMYYIPNGMTDQLQPQDVAVFAPLKSITNGKIKQKLFGIKII